jgi:hypothetical protein
VPKKTWRKKEAHGKANARALTSAEAAKRDLTARERQGKKQRPATPKDAQADEDVQVPATPEQVLPASTAPAKLAGGDSNGGEGRGKRKRTMTKAYEEARQAGLQSLGYSQVEK